MRVINFHHFQTGLHRTGESSSRIRVQLYILLARVPAAFLWHWHPLRHYTVIDPSIKATAERSPLKALLSQIALSPLRSSELECPLAPLASPPSFSFSIRSFDVAKAQLRESGRRETWTATGALIPTTAPSRLLRSLKALIHSSPGIARRRRGGGERGKAGEGGDTGDAARVTCVHLWSNLDIIRGHDGKTAFDRSSDISSLDSTGFARPHPHHRSARRLVFPQTKRDAPRISFLLPPLKQKSCSVCVSLACRSLYAHPCLI